MAEKPAVSVVIPLYNKSQYITRALISVFSQTFQDFEVIVVDDGSTDDGATVVKGFNDPRIQVIYQENRGVSAARNKGIEVARAELVAFLDADDEWLPGFLETVTRLKDQFPGAGAYSTAVGTSYKGIVKCSRYNSLPSPKWEGLIFDYFKSYILGDSLIRSSNVAIPREILHKMNGFKNGAKWGEDLDLWGRIALNYPIGFSTSCCSLIHITSGYLDKVNSRVTVTKEHPFISSAYTVMNKEHNNFTENECLMRFLDALVIQSAIANAIVGQEKDSREILCKCTSRAFILTRMVLNIWYSIPGGAIKNSGRIRERFLFITLSYLQIVEFRLLGFHMVHRRKTLV